MPDLHYMMAALKRRADREWFNWRCGGIRSTPPVRCRDDSDLVIVSQLYSPDVTMYLLAAKSLCRHIVPNRFVLVDDGLTAEDRHTLSRHLGRVEFRPTRDVGRAPFPRGGCWERLLTLSDLNRHHYVIQLDSDTLTLSSPAEVMDCVSRRRTFTLGTPDGRYIIPAAEAAAAAHAAPYEHVQSWCEQALADLPDAADVRYVRGCAGFTGFARGQLPAEGIQRWVEALAPLVGPERFAQWGSEQVASNLMAANADGAIVLPVERYPFFEPRIDIGRAALIHFFGTFRFRSGTYLAQSLRVVDELAGQGGH